MSDFERHAQTTTGVVVAGLIAWVGITITGLAGDQGLKSERLT